MIENGFQWETSGSLTKLSFSDIKRIKEERIIKKERAKKRLTKTKKTPVKRCTYTGKRTEIHIFYDGEVKTFKTVPDMISFLHESPSLAVEKRRIRSALKMNAPYDGFIIWRGEPEGYEDMRKIVYKKGYSVLDHGSWSFYTNIQSIADKYRCRSTMSALKKTALKRGFEIHIGRKDFL